MSQMKCKVHLTPSFFQAIIRCESPLFPIRYKVKIEFIINIKGRTLMNWIIKQQMFPVYDCWYCTPLPRSCPKEFCRNLLVCYSLLVFWYTVTVGWKCADFWWTYVSVFFPNMENIFRTGGNSEDQGIQTFINTSNITEASKSPSLGF